MYSSHRVYLKIQIFDNSNFIRAKIPQLPENIDSWSVKYQVYTVIVTVGFDDY